jgi:hypothetical protein
LPRDCAVLNRVIGRLWISGHEDNFQCRMALSCRSAECDAAEQFKQMQAILSFGTYTFKPARTLRSNADDPVGNESFASRFAQMQAQSSTSSEFQAPPVLTMQAAAPEGEESFAQRFAEMQAASSNSGQWKQLPSAGAPAYATSDTASAVASQRRSEPSLGATGVKTGG